MTLYKLSKNYSHTWYLVSLCWSHVCTMGSALLYRGTSRYSFYKLHDKNIILL